MIDHAWTFREFRAIQKTQEPRCFFDVPKLGPGKLFLARAKNTPVKHPSLRENESVVLEFGDPTNQFGSSSFGSETTEAPNPRAAVRSASVRAVASAESRAANVSPRLK